MDGFDSRILLQTEPPPFRVVVLFLCRAGSQTHSNACSTASTSLFSEGKYKSTPGSCSGKLHFLMEITGQICYHEGTNSSQNLNLTKECGSMKNKKLWWVLLIIGIIPFAAPFIGFAYEMINSSSWTLVDWLVLYSFVYWPTYVVGLILTIISVHKLRK